MLLHVITEGDTEDRDTKGLLHLLQVIDGQFLLKINYFVSVIKVELQAVGIDGVEDVSTFEDMVDHVKQGVRS